MSKHYLTAAAALAILVLPLGAQAQNAAGGAAAGAATGAGVGAIVGGPVGAAVGAAAGGIIGGLSAEQSAHVRQYVVREDRPSVRVEERIVVGEPLPRAVELYEIPQTQYRYTVVNNRRVIVDPNTRRVVEVIE